MAENRSITPAVISAYIGNFIAFIALLVTSYSVWWTLTIASATLAEAREQRNQELRPMVEFQSITEKIPAKLIQQYSEMHTVTDAPVGTLVNVGKVPVRDVSIQWLPIGSRQQSTVSPCVAAKMQPTSNGIASTFESLLPVTLLPGESMQIKSLPSIRGPEGENEGCSTIGLVIITFHDLDGGVHAVNRYFNMMVAKSGKSYNVLVSITDLPYSHEFPAARTIHRWESTSPPPPPALNPAP